MASNQNDVSEKQVASEKTEGPSENLAESASFSNDQKSFTDRNKEGRRDFDNQQDAQSFVKGLFERSGNRQTVNAQTDAVSAQASSSAEDISKRSPSASGDESKASAYGDQSARSASQSGSESKANVYGEQGGPSKTGGKGGGDAIASPVEGEMSKPESDKSSKPISTRGDGESGYMPKTANRDGETTHNTDEAGSRLKPARRPGTF